jgi:hypothetical protein
MRAACERRVEAQSNVLIQSLSSFLSRDVRSLSDSEKSTVRSALARLVPETASDEPWWWDRDYQTWYIWRISGSPDYLLVFQARPLISIPGVSKARVYFLSLSGQTLGKSEFETGYRIDILGANLERSVSGGMFLKIETRRSLSGMDIRWRYYEVGTYKLQLIRLEDSKGNVVKED